MDVAAASTSSVSAPHILESIASLRHADPKSVGDFASENRSLMAHSLGHRAYRIFSTLKSVYPEYFSRPERIRATAMSATAALPAVLPPASLIAVENNPRQSADHLAIRAMHQRFSNRWQQRG
jgi:hypothetical protein